MNKPLAERISKYSLTENEKRIATYFIEADTSVCFMRVAQIAAILNTSDMSVIRFCRKIGFSGYPDLQRELRSIYSANMEKDPNGVRSMSERYRKRIQKKACSNPSDKSFFRAFWDQLQNNLLDIFEKNENLVFQEAARAIYSAEKKYIVGFRGCTGVALDFSRLLRHTVCNVLSIIHEDRTAIEAMLDISPKDILVVFSLPQHGSCVGNLIQMAKNNGAKICVITDSFLNPITQNADYVLLTQQQGISYFNSQICSKVIAEYLLSLIADPNGETLNKRIDMIDQYQSADRK